MKMAAFAKRWIWLAAALALAVSGCGGGSKSATPPRASVDTETSTSSTPTVSESTTSTSVVTPSTMPEQHFEPLYADPALTPEEQVEAAYLFYWDVVLDAFARGDDRYLPLVLVDEGLAMHIDQIRRHNSQGIRMTGDKVHNYQIQVLEPTIAALLDEQYSRLRTEDVETGEVIEADPYEQKYWRYTLVKRDDQWLISDYATYVLE